LEAADEARAAGREAVSAEILDDGRWFRQAAAAEAALPCQQVLGGSGHSATPSDLAVTPAAILAPGTPDNLGFFIFYLPVDFRTKSIDINNVGRRVHTKPV
jgi:hypothetical protein